MDLRYFEHTHLPPRLRAAAKLFSELAERVADQGLYEVLRLLLEARDATMRAMTTFAVVEDVALIYLPRGTYATMKATVLRQVVAEAGSVRQAAHVGRPAQHP